MSSTAERAARIRAARGYAKMTAKDLAEEMGHSVETMSRIENGRKAVTDEQLALVAKVCDVPIEFMESGFELIRERGRALTQANLVRRLDQLEEHVRELVAQQAATALEEPKRSDAAPERPSRPRRRRPQ